MNGFTKTDIFLSFFCTKTEQCERGISESDGVPVGVGPLMLAIAHVKQPISGAESILTRL